MNNQKVGEGNLAAASSGLTSLISNWQKWQFSAP